MQQRFIQFSGVKCKIPSNQSYCWLIIFSKWSHTNSIKEYYETLIQKLSRKPFIESTLWCWTVENNLKQLFNSTISFTISIKSFLIWKIMPLFADRRISGNWKFSARTATHLAAKDLLHKNIMKFTEVTVTRTLLTRILARLIGRGISPCGDIAWHGAP